MQVIFISFAFFATPRKVTSVFRDYRNLMSVLNSRKTKKQFDEKLYFVDKNHSFPYLRVITLHLKLKFMKNKLLLVVATIIMAASTNKTHAQEFMAGNYNVNLGLGVGGYLSYTTFGDYTTTPLLIFSIDYGYMDDLGPGTLGIGGLIGYKATSYEYNYFGYSDKASWKDVVIGGRGTYHAYLDIDKLDVYGVFNAGIVVQQYTFDSNSPVAGESNTSSTNLNIYGGICAGAKYFLTDNLAAYAEVGYDVAWIKLGVTLKL